MENISLIPGPERSAVTRVSSLSAAREDWIAGSSPGNEGRG